MSFRNSQTTGQTINYIQLRPNSTYVSESGNKNNVQFNKPIQNPYNQSINTYATAQCHPCVFYKPAIHKRSQTCFQPIGGYKMPFESYAVNNTINTKPNSHEVPREVNYKVLKSSSAFQTNKKQSTYSSDIINLGHPIINSNDKATKHISYQNNNISNQIVNHKSFNLNSNVKKQDYQRHYARYSQDIIRPIYLTYEKKLNKCQEIIQVDRKNQQQYERIMLLKSNVSPLKCEIKVNQKQHDKNHQDLFESSNLSEQKTDQTTSISVQLQTALNLNKLLNCKINEYIMNIKQRDEQIIKTKAQKQTAIQQMGVIEQLKFKNLQLLSKISALQKFISQYQYKLKIEQIKQLYLRNRLLSQKASEDLNKISFLQKQILNQKAINEIQKEGFLNQMANYLLIQSGNKQINKKMQDQFQKIKLLQSALRTKTDQSYLSHRPLNQLIGQNDKLNKYNNELSKQNMRLNSIVHVMGSKVGQYQLYIHILNEQLMSLQVQFLNIKYHKMITQQNIILGDEVIRQ